MPENIDADPRNANWTKFNWHLPPYKSEEFMLLLQSMGDTLEDFRKTWVYKFAVEKGEIVDDEWVGKAGEEL